MVPRLANCMNLTNWDDRVCVVAPDSSEDIILGDGLTESWSCKGHGIIKFPHNLEKLYNILVRKTNKNLFTYFEGTGAWGLESSRLRTWRSRTPVLIPLNIFKQVTLMIGFLASFPIKWECTPGWKGKKMYFVNRSNLSRGWCSIFLVLRPSFPPHNAICSVLRTEQMHLSTVTGLGGTARPVMRPGVQQWTKQTPS